MLGTLLEIAAGIVGLSLVVLIHEGGHFVAARLTGVDVQTFSIGFGRRLWAFNRGGTDFQIALVPLGGFCRFKGEEAFRRAVDEHLPEIPAAPGEFYSAPPWKRILIALAGPLANILFAFVVFTSIAAIGYQQRYTEPRIILASEYSKDRQEWPADLAGLQTGDIIQRVDAQPVESFQELREALMFRPEETVELTVLRRGRTYRLNITPELDRDNGVALIGVLNWVEPVAAEIRPGSPAARSGILPGDVLVSLNGTTIRNSMDFLHQVSNADKALRPSTLIVERQGRKLNLSYTPAEAGAQGIPSGIVFRSLTKRSASLNISEAMAKGVTETARIFSSTLRGLRMLFLGIKVQNAVYGPIRLITDTGAMVVKGFSNGAGAGLLWTFELMALISVSLAFLNLLPIPVLDGGQILLFCIEGLKKSALSPRSVYRYQFIGTILVVIIAAIALTGDILSFHSG